MNDYAILLTVHNRKEKTLKCLTCLYAAIDHPATDVPLFDIYLTDDGSTDGTREAVARDFPQVRLIEGDGKLYWCRGMIASWKCAVASHDYDGFIWLNNDAYLLPDALTIMYGAINETGNTAIISGAFISEKTGQVSYGGKINDRLLTPNGHPAPFTQLNGNFVFVPKQAFNRLGMLDASFHHSLGDYDYGYRAAKAGIRLYMTPCYTGVCERDDRYHKYRDTRYSATERFCFLYSPLGPPPTEMFRFNIRHFSIFKAVFIFFYTNLVCLCPGVRKWMC
jgi:GT2 family glycosyltransferase